MCVCLNKCTTLGIQQYVYVYMHSCVAVLRRNHFSVDSSSSSLQVKSPGYKAATTTSNLSLILHTFTLKHLLRRKALEDQVQHNLSGTACSQTIVRSAGENLDRDLGRLRPFARHRKGIGKLHFALKWLRDP